jgi:hypothetical protein
MMATVTRAERRETTKNVAVTTTVPLAEEPKYPWKRSLNQEQNLARRWDWKSYGHCQQSLFVGVFVQIPFVDAEK